MNKLGPQAKWLKKIINQLKEIGVVEIDIRQKNHIFIKAKLEGCRFSWTVSKTPSSKNATRQAISDLKRELRKCGLDEVPDMTVNFLTPTPKDAWEPVKSAENIWAILEDWEASLDASQ